MACDLAASEAWGAPAVWGDDDPAASTFEPISVRWAFPSRAFYRTLFSFLPTR
jgi:hypothetical protein